MTNHQTRNIENVAGTCSSSLALVSGSSATLRAAASHTGTAAEDARQGVTSTEFPELDVNSKRALAALRRCLENGEPAFFDGAAALCLPPLVWVAWSGKLGEPLALDEIVAAARDKLVSNAGWVERLEAFLGDNGNTPADGGEALPTGLLEPAARCQPTALKYASLGWPVLPLHSVIEGACTCAKGPACPNPGKHPRVENGVKDATANPAIVAGWFQRWPNANVGIATGEQSSLVVLDIDPRHGGEDSFKELCERHGALPDTLSARSGGGGRHLFFRYTGNKIGNRTNLDSLSGLDVRGDGGYIVAAPSVHISGGSYSWIGELSLEAVLVAPDWFYSLATAKAAGARADSPRGGEPKHSGARILDGSRNDTLFRIGCRMRHAGAESKQIHAELQSVNASRCEPLLSEDEVQRIAQNATRYDPSPARTDRPLIPIPDGAPVPDTDHSQLGAAASIHTYRDKDGRPLWHVCSFWNQSKLTTRPLTLWGDEEATLRWLWRGPGKRHVLYRLPQLFANPEAQVLVVRDEPSADKAAPDFPSWAVTSPLFGAFGIRGADWAALKGRQVLVWDEDTDEGRAFVKAAADQIRGAGAAKVVVFSHDYRPDEDGGVFRGQVDVGVLPSAAAGWRETHLARLFEETIAPVASPMDEMNSIRDNQVKLPPHRRDQAIAGYLTASFRKRGKFYREQDEAYFFLLAERRLILLDGENQALARLLAEYGINGSEKIFAYLSQHLWLEATTHGTPTEVRHLSHYDRNRNTVYVFNQGGLIYKVTPAGVEVVENGADGILFLPEPEAEPFHIVDDFDPQAVDEHGRDPVRRALEEGLSLAPGHLAVAQGLMLLRYWIWGRLVPELLPTKPILAFVGEKGSAKTAGAKRIGTMLFGRNYEVASMTDDVKDFDAAASATSLLVVDNADTERKWLADKLAILATGGRVKKRVLYTTNTMVSIKPIAWVIITSRTPHFKRDDVADRLLLLRTARLTSFAGLADLDRRTVEQRDLLMTNLLHDLVGITLALRVHGADVVTGEVRMADFYSFAIRVSRHRGEEDEVKEAFRQLQRAQVGFAAEGDPVGNLIEIWLRVHGNAGKRIGATQLYSELCELAQRHRQSMPEGMTSRSFSQHLSASLEALKERFSVEVRSRQNTAEYIFRPLMDGPEQI